MYDGSSQMLTGALVRSSDGRTGRVAHVSLPWVRIVWSKTESKEQEIVSYSRSGVEVNENFQIHTLDRGWLPMRTVVTKNRARMESLLANVEETLEEENKKQGRCKCQQSEAATEADDTDPSITEDDTVDEDDTIDEDVSVDVELVYPTGKVEEMTLTGVTEIREFFTSVDEDFGDSAEVNFHAVDFDIIRDALGESWEGDADTELLSEAKAKRGRPLKVRRAKSAKQKAKASSKSPNKNRPDQGAGKWDCWRRKKYKYACKKLSQPGKGQVRKVETSAEQKKEYNRRFRSRMTAKKEYA